MYRQGDVLLIPVDRITYEAAKGMKRAKEGDKEGERWILARGEKSGHHHAVPVADAEFIERTRAPFPGEARGRLRADQPDNTADVVDHFLRVRSVTTLTHEEHAPITLPAGDYQVVLQREFDPIAESERAERLRAAYD